MTYHVYPPPRVQITSIFVAHSVVSLVPKSTRGSLTSSDIFLENKLLTIFLCFFIITSKYRKPTSRGHWCHKDEMCKQSPCCSPVQKEIVIESVTRIDLKILKILRRKGWGNYVWFYLSGEKKEKKEYFVPLYLPPPR